MTSKYTKEERKQLLFMLYWTRIQAKLAEHHFVHSAVAEYLNENVKGQKRKDLLIQIIHSLNYSPKIKNALINILEKYSTIKDEHARKKLYDQMLLLFSKIDEDFKKQFAKQGLPIGIEK